MLGLSVGIQEKKGPPETLKKNFLGPEKFFFHVFAVRILLFCLAPARLSSLPWGCPCPAQLPWRSRLGQWPDSQNKLHLRICYSNATFCRSEFKNNWVHRKHKNKLFGARKVFVSRLRGSNSPLLSGSCPLVQPSLGLPLPCPTALAVPFGAMARFAKQTTSTYLLLKYDFLKLIIPERYPETYILK